MKNKESMEGIILSLLSMFFLRESLKLHNNQPWALSPALFPLIITFVALLFSISLIIKGIGKSSVNRENGELKIMLLIVALSFLYLFLLPKVHFVLASIIYLFCFMIILGERKWWVLGSISFITPFIIEFLFGNLLDVFLP